jgi:ABC-2 type transport system ATP-binding protein
MVVLNGLEKSFGAVRAVRGVDIEIRRGETVALLGPNGAGKSTTIDMLLGLQTPDRGSVEILGRSPADATAAGMVGAMLQTGSLIRDLTVRELVGMMASLHSDPLDVDEALELVGARGFAEQRTEKLSGGETQRARAAVALVGDPELLVLDEPTSALDVSGRRDFWRLMRGAAAGGKTILFATHYLEEADSFADRVILMSQGQVVADGPTGQIKSTVGSRTIRVTLPDAGADELEELPGVSSAELHGQTAILVCHDSDAAIRALLEDYPEARDVEITAAGLEQAFLALTTDGAS